MLSNLNKNNKGISNKFIGFMMIIFIVISFSHTAILASEDNLIENSGFEEELSKTWNQVKWNSNEGISNVIQDTSDSKSGQASVKLTNIEENDFRILQEIQVKTNQLYKFSAFIKTDNIKVGSYGGAISIWETFLGTGSVVTNGEWEYVEFYGKTGPEQNSLLVTYGLGGYGHVTTGSAWFDDVSILPVDHVPEGVTIQQLNETEQAISVVEENNTEVKKQYIYVYAGLYLLLLFALYYGLFYKGINLENLNKTAFLIGVLGIITVIKLFIAPLTQGFDNDMALFNNWGYRAASDFSGLYESEGFLDYPPLYMYVLVIIGKLNQWFDIRTGGYLYEFLLKLPSIVADACTGFLLFKISGKLNIKKIGFIAAFIYVLNPLVILDSTIWGQVDSLFVLIILSALYFMWQDKMVISSISFVLAVLLKPQGIIFLPILFFELVHRRDLKLFIECFIKSLLATIIVILPFTFKSGPLFIIKLYIGTVGGYTYATFNAFNLFGLLGANYTPDNESLFILSYGLWGLIGIILVTSFVMWLFYKHYTKLTPIVGSLILCSGVFIFSARMHERYMFPVLALLLASYLLNNNKKYLIVFIGFTITNLVNVQLVLYHHYFIEELYIDPNSMIIKVVALFNILLFIWLIQITLKDPIKIHRTVQVKKPKKSIKSKSIHHIQSIYEEDRRDYRLTKKDFMIMVIMSLVYLFLTLYQLGDLKSPETSWTIPESKESFSVEFDQFYDLNHISYYTGVANGYDNSGSMTVEALTMNNDFLPIGQIEEDGTFLWKVFQTDVTTKELRFTSTKKGGSIHEIGFYDNQEKLMKDYVIKNKTENIGEINHLFDEQNKMEIYPTRMNSSYFDEIYFARTAYEMDQDYYLYESTHPTLGKLMILIGIKIFGNNPFGWRIIGALMGVLLIPIMYIFGKRLFGNSLLAFASGFLMMFDFMHFTHSRFASIDIYTVVFVVLMYYFMHRYFLLDTYKAKRSESIKYLILSAAFMTLGISTKWNVVYGVVGLAITFFASRYYILSYYSEKGIFTRHQGSMKHPFIKKEIVDTFIYCIPLFIIIPIIVYGVLQIPVISNSSESGLKQIIDYQLGMYKYHSTNKATHPFSSKWYEWPTMIKPLWLYSYSYAQAGMKSTIASFGNPAIWWPGIPAFFAAGIIMIKEKDRKFALVFIAYLMQILPWVMVERTTYIYHYFTAIPFNMFMIIYVFNYLIKKNHKYKYLLYGYLTSVLILFIIFYPVLSGMTVEESYIEKLLLLKSWYF